MQAPPEYGLPSVNIYGPEMDVPPHAYGNIKAHSDKDRGGKARETPAYVRM